MITEQHIGIRCCVYADATEMLRPALKGDTAVYRLVKGHCSYDCMPSG